MNKIIGIIGFGNMGSAIGEQIKADYKVIVFDKDPARSSGASGIAIAGDICELVDKSDICVLAVKPQDFGQVLGQIKACGHLTDKLFISIAAGITTYYIEKMLGVVRVVRVMPNLPARIGRGISCLARGRFASDTDLEFADDMFEYLGEVTEIEEPMINAATAVSGSGPAYVCDFLVKKKIDITDISGEQKEEFLKEFGSAARDLGFTDRQASVLTRLTWEGTIAYLKRSSLSPQELIRQVMSRGGTTEAAFTILEAGGTLKAAIEAGRKRADELSK